MKTMTWCTAFTASGRISMAVTHLSSSKFVLVYEYLYSTTPWAGTLNVSDAATIASGVPMFHPFTNFLDNGASFALPSGAPLCAHVIRSSRSRGDSDRSFAHSPILRCANQGGMRPLFVMNSIVARRSDTCL